MLKYAVAAGLAALPILPASAQAQVLTPAQALAEDAAEYARLRGIGPAEALARLQAQEASVAASDAIRARFADRFAGIAVEHAPDQHLSVLLTGDAPVPEETVAAGGTPMRVVYRTGAGATRAQVLAAITEHRAEIRRRVPGMRGMGHDPRTGALALVLRSAPPEGLEAELSALTGVPVRIRRTDAEPANLSVAGGRRMEGSDPDSERRYVCTSGFVVTDGARTGVITAAHCPERSAIRENGTLGPQLGHVGQWGWAYRDVQVHDVEGTAEPVFRGGEGGDRLVRTWRNRESTRAGDFVCHRGASSGYSCGFVESIDFAPPGDLCGGPCDPSWVAVSGARCRRGDSGGPVFVGNTAFGILKGGADVSGDCAVFYYMSTDFLPDGWRLAYR